jgi:glutamate carboxypeptidase
MPSPQPGSPPLSVLREAVASTFDRYLAELEELVNIDCGSYTREGVNAVATHVEAELARLGADVKRIPHRPVGDESQLGDLVVGRLAGEGPRLLLIGHMDTVFGPGTAVSRPFRCDGDRATGPGTSDMKGGLLAGLHAIGALQTAGSKPAITFVANPDEEIGSPFSGHHIRALAAEHDAALILECARANGDIVSARKGVADLAIDFHGRAAHAGVEPEKGRNAILAAARAVEALHALNGRWEGVTVNAGVIAGGTRPNVIAAECRLEVDLRGATAQTFDEARKALDLIVAEPAVRGVIADLREGAMHRPMEATPPAKRLARLAATIAAELGFELHDAATGGASDGNTTSAAGLPTLDGLGPIGGDDHSEEEWLDLSSVVPRTTLLAGLISRIGEAL